MNRLLLGLTLGTIAASAAYAAGPDLGAVQQSATNWPAILMFLFFVLLTLGITYKAANHFFGITYNLSKVKKISLEKGIE